MPAPVSIIIPAHNQLQYCRQCIDSIRTHTDPGTYRLVLVDNASTDGVAEYFDRIPDSTVVHAPENMGYAGGVNLGMEHAEGHVLILNSDTLAPRDWLPRMVAALESDNCVGMVGPMSNYVSGAQLIPDLDFATMDEINAFSDRLYEEHRGRFDFSTRLVGFCLLIKESVWQQVGEFDESFGIGNYEDDDYGMRVQSAGFELRIARDSFVFHYGSRTFLGMGVVGAEWERLLDENGRRFHTKWNRAHVPDRAGERQRSESINRDARVAHARGDLRAAMTLFAEAIAACPALETNYNDFGVVLWEIGERDQAIRQFERALLINPSYESARDNLMDAARATNTESKAMTFLERTRGVINVDRQSLT